MFVAEMDYPLAEPIRRALHEAIDRGDAGYVASREPACGGVPRATPTGGGAGTSTRRALLTTADVSMGIVEILRRVTTPGDPVVITPPVYPPFFDLVDRGGSSRRCAVPLRRPGDGLRLDLAALEAAFASGARRSCSATRTTRSGTRTAGTNWSQRRRSRRRTRRHGHQRRDPRAAHAAGCDLHSLPQRVRQRTRYGFAVHSASKAWNIAGLKCAVMVADGERPAGILDGMPFEVEWRTGQFGMLASAAAYAEGQDWLDGVLESLASNIDLLDRLLREHLPGVTWHRPEASYLAWLDFRGGDGETTRPSGSSATRVSPSARSRVRRARGRLRTMNIACSPELLDGGGPADRPDPAGESGAEHAERAATRQAPSRRQRRLSG